MIEKLLIIDLRCLPSQSGNGRNSSKANTSIPTTTSDLKHPECKSKLSKRNQTDNSIAPLFRLPPVPVTKDSPHTKENRADKTCCIDANQVASLLKSLKPVSTQGVEVARKTVTLSSRTNNIEVAFI